MEDGDRDTLGDLLAGAAEGEENSLDVIRETVPFIDEDGKEGELDGRRIVVSRRQLQPEPEVEDELARSPRRCHVFNHAAGFLRYLGNYGGKNTVILADVKGMEIHAVLDEGALIGKETVRYQPRLHPRFEPWANACGKQLGIDDLVDFLRENRKAVINPSGRELVLSLSQVRASTSVELFQGDGNDSLNGLTVKTKIQGKDDSSLVNLPESITIRVPMLIEDEEPREIELDLILAANRDGTNVTGRFATADVAEARVTSFMDVVTALADLEGTHEGAVVTFGKPDECGWAVV